MLFGVLAKSLIIVDSCIAFGSTAVVSRCVLLLVLPASSSCPGFGSTKVMSLSVQSSLHASSSSHFSAPLRLCPVGCVLLPLPPASSFGLPSLRLHCGCSVASTCFCLLLVPFACHAFGSTAVVSRCVLLLLPPASRLPSFRLHCGCVLLRTVAFASAGSACPLQLFSVVSCCFCILRVHLAHLSAPLQLCYVAFR